MSDTKTKATPRRWRQWREPDARKALAAWKRSGLGLDAFARSVGVSPSRLRNWQRRLMDDEPSVRFVPVAHLPAAPASVLEFTVRGVVLRAREDLAEDRLARIVAALVAALPPC